MAEDWKGEHLIRARRPEVGEDLRQIGSMRAGGSMVARKKATVRATVCVVPGCGKSLWSGNENGVCRSHNHAAGYCRCHQCLRQQA